MSRRASSLKELILLDDSWWQNCICWRLLLLGWRRGRIVVCAESNVLVWRLVYRLVCRLVHCEKWRQLNWRTLRTVIRGGAIEVSVLTQSSTMSTLSDILNEMLESWAKWERHVSWSPRPPHGEIDNLDPEAWGCVEPLRITLGQVW